MGLEVQRREDAGGRAPWTGADGGRLAGLGSWEAGVDVLLLATRKSNRRFQSSRPARGSRSWWRRMARADEACREEEWITACDSSQRT